MSARPHSAFRDASGMPPAESANSRILQNKINSSFEVKTFEFPPQPPPTTATTATTTTTTQQASAPPTPKAARQPSSNSSRTPAAVSTSQLQPQPPSTPTSASKQQQQQQYQQPPPKPLHSLPPRPGAIATPAVTAVVETKLYAGGGGGSLTTVSVHLGSNENGNTVAMVAATGDYHPYGEAHISDETLAAVDEMLEEERRLAAAAASQFVGGGVQNDDEMEEGEAGELFDDNVAEEHERKKAKN
ncbi:hypothetical protein HK100_008015 [Physocladia obscura]|uniref:Uncharacterized protein n=1 Tax=Physocladia obscura TaxID=109957 RepID=A0AAD5XAS9_9FUNG|nr:hypothetical protein HK100_008015 [Physocladia obscura]